MNLRNIRVIVISKSLELKQTVRHALESLPETEMLIITSTVLDLQSRLHKVFKNLVIFDLDSLKISPKLVEWYVENKNIYFLWTSVNRENAIPYLHIGSGHFVLMPSILPLSEQSYGRELQHYYYRYAQITPNFHFKDQIKMVSPYQKIIAIASSSGGTEALETIFRCLPANCPPVLVVQHIRPGFISLFANRLASCCELDFKEASGNDFLRNGLVLFAPSDYHMRLVVRNTWLCVECFRGQKINGVMPAADVLFDSIGPIMKKNALGIILTGMGSDGAIGLKNMLAYGAMTVGQDQKTSLIYGMPKAAYNLGAVKVQLPLDQIATKIIQWAEITAHDTK